MKKKKRVLSLLLAFALMGSLLAGVCVSASATNQAVQETANGVLQINTVYTDDNNNEIVLSYGSCFLINEDTIVTCAHCVEYTDYDWEYLAAFFGRSVSDFKTQISYSVTITRDVTVPVRIDNVSIDMDWAVLTLARTLQDHVPLTLRSSDTVELTENVYAVGFPALISYAEDVNTYTSSDVTITNGQVNKVSYGENIFSHKNYDFIQSSCKLSSGNSGGPLVDENGYVVGVCEGAWGTQFTDEYYTSVAIDQVIVYLQAMGIEYKMADIEEPQVEPTEAATEIQMPETEAIAITEAPIVTEAVSDNIPVNVEKQGEGGLSTVTLIVIIVAALLLIGVIVLVVVLAAGKKKKSTATSEQRVPVGVAASPVPPQQPAAPFHQPTAPPVAPFATAPAVSGAGETTVLSGAGETTLLNAGAGETSVLSMAPLCKLIHEKNNETISISKPDFSIGKERARVDYCISDNNSVSRLHARIVCKEGKFFIIDQNATNGTYVNNVRSQPRREVEIKDGDQIKLSDEIFTFKVER